MQAARGEKIVRPPLAWLRLAVVALATTAFLTACGEGLPADATSAADAADRVGCTGQKPVDVPKDWQDYDQAVECQLEGANVVIVWKESEPGEGNTAVICEPGTQPECEAAMTAYLPHVSDD